MMNPPVEYVNHPHEVVASTQPHEVVASTQPHEVVASTQPHEVVARMQPHEVVARMQPHEVVASTQPDEVVASTQPQTIIIQSTSPTSGNCNKNCLSRHPKELGVIQICNGSVSILLSILGLIFDSYMADRGYGMWCGVVYILAGISGVRAVEAKANTNCWMTSFMLLSLFSAILSVVTLVFGAMALDASYWLSLDTIVISALLVVLACWEGVIAILSLVGSCVATRRQETQDQVTQSNVPVVQYGQPGTQPPAVYGTSPQPGVWLQSNVPVVQYGQPGPQPPAVYGTSPQPGTELQSNVPVVQYGQPGTQRPVVYGTSPQPGVWLQSNVPVVQYGQPGTQPPAVYGTSPQPCAGNTQQPGQDRNVMGVEAGRYSADPQHLSHQPMQQPDSDQEMAPPPPALETPPPSYEDCMQSPALSAAAEENQLN